MVGPLIIFIFMVSGAASGWLGVDLLPDKTLIQTSNIQGFRIILTGFGTFLGALAGLLFQYIRNKLLNQIKSMPTDLLLSRSVGLILGLLVIRY